MKLNKKKVAAVIAIIICLIVGIVYFLYPSNNQNKPQQKKKTTNQFEKLNYYQENNLDRYQDYSKEHPELKVSDVVTQVNMNLDYGFYNQVIIQDKPNDLSTLVNKFYKLDDQYEPQDLVEINSYENENDYAYAYRKHQARRVVYDDFIALKKACKQQGFELYVTSGYRSTTWQKEIYQHMVDTYDQERADQTCSRPGHSEHTTGLSMDVALDQYKFEDIVQHPQYQWFLEQLPKYGFILRYPDGKENLTGYQYESWHIRYLGVELAQKVTKSHLTYDEYYARNH